MPKIFAILKVNNFLLHHFKGKFNLINFYSLLYCTFDGNVIWLSLLGIILIYLIFTFITATVEEYIVPGITYISEALKLSEAMAAVTLLALANGAGDVITAIVAASAPGRAGISYDVGALYGAGFFVAAVITFNNI